MTYEWNDISLKFYMTPFMVVFLNGCWIMGKKWETEDELYELVRQLFEEHGPVNTPTILHNEYKFLTELVKGWVNIFMKTFPSGGESFGKQWSNSDDLTYILNSAITEQLDATLEKFQREHCVCVNKKLLNNELNWIITYIAEAMVSNNHVRFRDMVPEFLHEELLRTDTSDVEEVKKLMVIVFTDTNRYMAYEEMYHFIIESKIFVDSCVAENNAKRRK